MPRAISEGFDDFLVKLKASAPESDAAKRHRFSIEACLRSNFGLNRFVRIGLVRQWNQHLWLQRR